MRNIWWCEESASDAKRSALVSFLLTFIVQGAIIAIIMPISNVLGKLFSHDEDVSQPIAQLIPVACIFMMGDAFQSNAGGVLRGLGRQNLLFLLNVIGFWLLALPSGALLTFVADVGVSGLLVGHDNRNLFIISHWYCIVEVLH